MCLYHTNKGTIALVQPIDSKKKVKLKPRGSALCAIQSRSSEDWLQKALAQIHSHFTLWNTHSVKKKITAQNKVHQPKLWYGGSSENILLVKWKIGVGVLCLFPVFDRYSVWMAQGWLRRLLQLQLYPDMFNFGSKNTRWGCHVSPKNGHLSEDDVTEGCLLLQRELDVKSESKHVSSTQIMWLNVNQLHVYIL